MTFTIITKKKHKELHLRTAAGSSLAEDVRHQRDRQSMSEWDIDACLSCGGSASRYRHGARGDCARCHAIKVYIKQVREWDRTKPATLKHVPDDGFRVESTDRSKRRFVKTGRLITDSCSSEEFEKIRAECIRQLESRLHLLHTRESIRRRELPVRGLDVEEKLRQVLCHMRGVRRRDRKQFPHLANEVNTHFKR